MTEGPNALCTPANLKFNLPAGLTWLTIKLEIEFSSFKTNSIKAYYNEKVIAITTKLYVTGSSGGAKILV